MDTGNRLDGMREHHPLDAPTGAAPMMLGDADKYVPTTHKLTPMEWDKAQEV